MTTLLQVWEPVARLSKQRKRRGGQKKNQRLNTPSKIESST